MSAGNAPRVDDKNKRKIRNGESEKRKRKQAAERWLNLICVALRRSRMKRWAAAMRMARKAAFALQFVHVNALFAESISLSSDAAAPSYPTFLKSRICTVLTLFPYL